MNKRCLLWFSLGWLLVAGSSNAADTTKITAQQRANIVKLMELTGADNIGLQVISQVKAKFKGQLDKTEEELLMKILDNIKPSEAITFMVPIYHKYLKDDEVKQMIAFYESPLGVKIREVMPSINSEATKAGQEWAKQIATEALNKLDAQQK